MTQVEMSQAQERFLELLEKAEHGEEVMIYRNSQPVVRLMAVQPSKTPDSLAQACLAANADVSLIAEIDEWQAMEDGFPE